MQVESVQPDGQSGRILRELSRDETIVSRSCRPDPLVISSESIGGVLPGLALALRPGRPRRVRLYGERAGELAAGADAELGEDLA
jgi:hypothetical protein